MDSMCLVQGFAHSSYSINTSRGENKKEGERNGEREKGREKEKEGGSPGRRGKQLRVTSQ